MSAGIETPVTGTYRAKVDDMFVEEPYVVPICDFEGAAGRVVSFDLGKDSGETVRKE